MRRKRGFNLRRKIIRVIGWVKSPKKCHLSDKPTRKNNEAISKLRNWGNSIKRGLFNKSSKGYIRVGHDTDERKRVRVPKGHLAVYVGEQEDDTRRVLVPAIYFNHPLFERLLKQAEKVYGFDHPGRIMIPCPVSEFESVQSRIAAGEKFRPRLLHHHRFRVSGVR